jgi:phospholipid transport system substrate-binding protein
LRLISLGTFVLGGVLLSGVTLAAGESATPPAAGDRSPDHAAIVAIERLHASIIDVMKNATALGFEGRRKKLQPVMSSTFDFDFMSEKSAGRYWNDLTPEQKQRWSDTFGRLTIATYAGRFNKYSDQVFETLGVETGGFDTVLVRTKLNQPRDQDVQLSYRMRETPSGWRIVDIYLNGTVSELALRRAEYGSVLQRYGFDKLVQDLEAKITAFQNGATG